MSRNFRTGRIDWEDVRFFASLARHGSLSATARALGVNHATVARRIAALEEAHDEHPLLDLEVNADRGILTSSPS